MVCVGGQQVVLNCERFTIHNFYSSWPSQEVIVRSVLSLKWKISWYTNKYVGIILKSCWYNLYVNTADLFNDIFLI